MFLVNCEVFLEILWHFLIKVHAKGVQTFWLWYQFDLHNLWFNAAAQTQKSYVSFITTCWECFHLWIRQMPFIRSKLTQHERHTFHQFMHVQLAEICNINNKSLLVWQIFYYYYFVCVCVCVCVFHNIIFLLIILNPIKVNFYPTITTVLFNLLDLIQGLG